MFSPTGRGPCDGKSFFILFGYDPHSERDRGMRDAEIAHLGDDVAALQAAGCRVIVDLHGTAPALDLALRSDDPDCAGTQIVGVLWSGHGCEDGSLAGYDNTCVVPEALSAEVSARGTVRLFMMSACWVGQHSPRWKQALGPQAYVIGWGRPVTLGRAIDFMSPDASSSKDLDDLLLTTLGVRPVVEDGPLLALQALAAEHAARLLAEALAGGDAGEGDADDDAGDDDGEDEDMEFSALITAVATKLGAMVSEDDGTYTLTLGVTDSDRTHMVFVYALPDSGMIRVFTTVGEYSEALDLARALREVRAYNYSRLYIGAKSDEGVERIMMEAHAFSRGLTVAGLATVVQEVADAADLCEDLFFGSDDL